MQYWINYLPIYKHCILTLLYNCELIPEQWVTYPSYLATIHWSRLIKHKTEKNLSIESLNQIF